jgi:hypothetical protein
MEHLPLDKLLMVVTNFVFVIPAARGTLGRSFGDSTRFLVLLYLAGVTSMIHHAVEMRYTEEAIVYTSSSMQWCLLQSDRFFALVAILGMGSVRLVRENAGAVSLALALMLSSEIVMYIPSLHHGKWVRAVLHSLWHILSLGYMATLAVMPPYKHDKKFADIIYSWLTSSQKRW